MSTIEIIAELPKLGPEDRRQLLTRLYELEERDLLQGNGPTEQEKRLLDAELAAFEADKNMGAPWRETLKAIRTVGRN